jgi:hypothetical protein
VVVFSFFRYVADDGTYELLLPADWLMDQSVVLAKAQRFQASTAGPSLGPGLNNQEVLGLPGGGGARRNRGVIPDAAFGPAKSSLDSGLASVSVVRSKLAVPYRFRAV